MKKLILLTLISMTSQISFADTEVRGVRVWPSPEGVRVVFDLDHKANYKIYTLSNPERVVVDFAETRLATKLSEVPLESTGITKLRSGVHANKTLRIVFELEKMVNPKDFSLEPNEKYGHRLVVDLESNEKQAILALFDLDNKVEAPKPTDFIIALDPGHGGEDPGAIGPKGTREKDVVLSIAKDLQNMINQQPGMKSFLTRNGDYYVGLRERSQRARLKNADLFISIHADAFKNPKADGASVFVMTYSRASSEAARWLAASENRSDLVGGVSLDDKSDLLAQVILDLSQTANASASLEAANHVLTSLGKTTLLHKGQVEGAGFAVLKAPDVPSLLVESGFISNPKTEQKLRTKKYQREIATSIMSGVKDYFNGKKHRNVYIQEAKRTQTTRYKVKNGDTLSKIAVRNNTTVMRLRKLNNLGNDNLKIGQTIIVSKD